MRTLALIATLLLALSGRAEPVTPDMSNADYSPFDSHTRQHSIRR